MLLHVQRTHMARCSTHRTAMHTIKGPVVHAMHGHQALVGCAPFPRRIPQHDIQQRCKASSGAAASGDPDKGSDAVGPAIGDPFKTVVLPTALALLVCNMDRICLSVAILPMAMEFGWPMGMQGVIQSAFLYGYMATQLLGGYLADKFGGKLVMAGGIIWFSLASMLMPLCLPSASTEAGFTLTVVLIARCLVEMVGADRPLNSGNVWLAGLVPDLRSGRRTTGGLLDVDCGGTAVPDSEIGPLQLMSKSATWAIIIVNVVNHWGYFIYLNWMPTYFSKALGFDLRGSSFVSFLPWLVMAVGSSCSGVLADSMVKKGHSVTFVRKLFQAVAFLVPAAALLVLATPGISPQIAIAAMTTALGTTSLGQAGFVANMSDIAPRHAGKMFGVCNTFGSFAGILGVTAVGFIVEATGSFSPVFYLTSAFYVVGTLAWLLMCTGERVF
eukprot:gene5799-6082_t